MKTIKQIADELGISKQKAARYIKSNNLYVLRNGLLIHIDDTIETLIKRHFLENNRINESHQNHISDTVYETITRKRQSNKIIIRKIRSRTKTTSSNHSG